MKKKEADENKGKNLGAVGITKFKSRSFEAFQKSGGKNLFPVDPSTPLEERPYMQRPGGKYTFFASTFVFFTLECLWSLTYASTCYLQIDRYARWF